MFNQKHNKSGTVEPKLQRTESDMETKYLKEIFTLKNF